MTDFDAPAAAEDGRDDDVGATASSAACWDTCLRSLELRHALSFVGLFSSDDDAYWQSGVESLISRGNVCFVAYLQLCIQQREQDLPLIYRES